MFHETMYLIFQHVLQNNLINVSKVVNIATQSILFFVIKTVSQCCLKPGNYTSINN